MSRVSQNPVKIPNNVDINITPTEIAVKGPLGELKQTLTNDIKLQFKDSSLTVNTANETKHANALSGTIRSLIANMVHGVDKGFQKKLTLVGVGYRVQTSGKEINLSVGLSHPIVHRLPPDITAETPSQTELVIKGIDKQRVGQTAAEIRAYRRPEKYKGKGIRYADEVIILKEAKKK